MPSFIPSKAPYETPPEDRLWENPDPKIKWALDILDDEGFSQESIMQRGVYPLAGAGGGFLASVMQNRLYRRPLFANLPMYALTIGLGVIGCEAIRKWQIHQAREEDALTRHYIMLHPEKFPEPEMKKFGDKEVMWEYTPVRGSLWKGNYKHG